MATTPPGAGTGSGRAHTLLILLAGIAVVAWQGSQQRKLERRLDALQEAVRATAQASSPGAVAPQPGAPDTTPDLVALRGELAALRRDLSAGIPPADGSPATPGRTAGKVPPPSALPPHVQRGFVDPSGIPAPVLATLRQQLGDVPIEGAHVKRADGRLHYALEARLADGRNMEIALDEDGTIRHRHLEMAYDSLDPTLRTIADSVVGTTPVRQVAEVYEDGRTVYRVVAKSPDQGIQLVLAPDGTVLRIEVQRPERAP